MFASKGLVRSRCMDIELVYGGGPIAKKNEKKTTTAIGFAPFQRKAIYHQNMSNYIVWLPLKKQILKIRSMLLETIALPQWLANLRIFLVGYLSEHPSYRQMWVGSLKHPPPWFGDYITRILVTPSESFHTSQRKLFRLRQLMVD